MRKSEFELFDMATPVNKLKDKEATNSIHFLKTTVNLANNVFHFNACSS